MMDNKQLVLDLLCLAHGTRLRIVRLLLKERALVSSMIAVRLGVRPSVAAHHLRILSQGGLIKGAKSGRYMTYCLDRERLNSVTYELCVLTGNE